MDDITPRQPLTISQAFNFLKNTGDRIAAKIKKAVKENAKISVAPPRDRRKFLNYGISLLEKVDSENADLFFTITGKSRRLYSNTELAVMFKQLLTLRVHGYSLEQIAHVLHTPPDILGKVEKIAIVSVNRAIEKAQVGKVPLLGGLNG